jgi:GABA permease
MGFVSVIFNAISPDKVFLFLVNASGAVALFVYLLICVAELRMRRRLEAEAPERLKLKMWLFPYLTYATMAAMVAVIVSVGLVKDTRSQLIPSLISLAVVLVAAWVMNRRRSGDRAPAASGAQTTRA